MMKLQTIKQVANDERGMSLIPIALLIIVLGLLISSGALIYALWDESKGRYSTDSDLSNVQAALQQYYAVNGRYPCPAPLTAPIDSAAFGVEIGAGDCVAAPNVAGTFQTAGVDAQQVRIGTVPTRTLGIEDEHMFDGFRHRLVYAVTAAYAVDGSLVTGDDGDINIIDIDGSDSMVRPSTVAQVVYSMGGDENGAYDVNGNQISPCDTAAVSGENCDFSTAAINATFRNSVNKSNVENANKFAGRMKYPVPKTFLTCEDLGLTIPQDVSFIMDTSGSMGWNGGACPAELGPAGSTCRRVHNAQWAMRRVMLSRLEAVKDLDDPGSTSFAGFAKDGNGNPYSSSNSVDNGLGDIVFDDPSDPNYVPPEPEDTLDQLNNELAGMCPNGGTPLGVHLRVLADRLGVSTPDRPHKIIALSDGENTMGEDPASAVAYIRATYPNMKIDIIDVAYNPGLEQLETDYPDTVTYYQTNDPISLKDSLKQAAGICSRYEPAVNNDPTPC